MLLNWMCEISWSSSQWALIRRSFGSARRSRIQTRRADLFFARRSDTASLRVHSGKRLGSPNYSIKLCAEMWRPFIMTSYLDQSALLEPYRIDAQGLARAVEQHAQRLRKRWSEMGIPKQTGEAPLASSCNQGICSDDDWASGDNGAPGEA